MVVAPIAPARERDLRQLLASMNRAPGIVDPRNSLVPFGSFDRLHFARLLILDDTTTSDISVFGVAPASYPTYLAFLGDIDGDADEFLADIVGHAGRGLEMIFSNCSDFRGGADLFAVDESPKSSL